MASPFPGMDPYLETPRHWLDFHHALAAEIRSLLNVSLGPGYAAWLDSYAAYETVEVARLLEAPAQLFRVEIRTTGDDQLVTAIEILSPANKRAGHDDCLEYQRKRRALLRSSAHLMEIDLLRGGERPPLEKPVPAAPYYVVLSRADRRATVEVWPIQLKDPLPVLPVPLLEPDPDVPLDLGAAVGSVYDSGPYQRVINYQEPPPPPPLAPEEAAWVEQRLQQ
jgi:hypothetical protein